MLYLSIKDVFPFRYSIIIFVSRNIIYKTLFLIFWQTLQSPLCLQMDLSYLSLFHQQTKYNSVDLDLAFCIGKWVYYFFSKIVIHYFFIILYKIYNKFHKLLLVRVKSYLKYILHFRTVYL